MFEAAKNEFGGVSVSKQSSPRINQKPFKSMEWEDIQDQLDVQVKGAFMMTDAVEAEMASRKWGRIVNITSQVLDGAPLFHGLVMLWLRGR